MADNFLAKVVTGIFAAGGVRQFGPLGT